MKLVKNNRQYYNKDQELLKYRPKKKKKKKMGYVIQFLVANKKKKKLNDFAISSEISVIQLFVPKAMHTKLKGGRNHKI